MDEVQRLKEIIDARGIKGSFIDKALGKPRNWYSNIINRRKRLEIIDMTLLAALLSVPIAVFFAFEVRKK